MTTITTINENDGISPSRTVINNNFAALNADKIETSVLDPDTTMAANSDDKIPTQKAVRAFVESGGVTKAKLRAYKSGSAQVIDTSYEKVLFETENFDVGGNFTASTFTAPRNGYYNISASGSGTSGSTTARGVSIAIYKNGVLYSQTANPMTANSAVISGLNITDTLFLAAGDTIEIYAYASSNSITFETGEANTFLTIIEL